MAPAAWRQAGADESASLVVLANSGGGQRPTSVVVGGDHGRPQRWERADPIDVEVDCVVSPADGAG